MKLSWRVSGRHHALLVMSFPDESADIVCERPEELLFIRFTILD